MSQLELLRLVLEVFDQLQIQSMLVGSHASSHYGEARSTHDIDMVIDLPSGKIDALVASFDSERYYLSKQALQEGRMANLIDTVSGDKVDFFLLSNDPIARSEFARRKNGKLLDLAVTFASAEDTILAKLHWSRQIGGSERQQRDVREILRAQSEKLDLDYLERAAEAKSLTAELNQALRDIKS